MVQLFNWKKCSTNCLLIINKVWIKKAIFILKINKMLLKYKLLHFILFF